MNKLRKALFGIAGMTAAALIGFTAAPAGGFSPLPGIAVVSEAAESIRYLDAGGKTQTAAQYTVLDGSMTSWNTGTYYLSEDTIISDRITVTGTVTLILGDGAEFYAEKGITVNEGNTLNICAQSAGENTGKLTVPGAPDYCAGIGGENGKSSGTINISGGNITVNGGTEGAGIGGGSCGGGGTISISGGTVTADGGAGGAGIGGGREGKGGKITITGTAYVTASGKYSSASAQSSNCYGSAGIGGGSAFYSRSDGGEITISGSCTVYAFGSGCIVNRDAGGNIISVERDEKNRGNGAGIGGGYNSGGGKITIEGGTKYAYGGKITIEGGTVYAYGGENAAGIGGGAYGGCTISITGGTVTANGGAGGAGIGGGYGGAGGTITIENGTVNATGGNGGAGIGSGDHGAGGTVTIENGTVTATGGNGGAGIGGAGIGGGSECSGGTISISGKGKVTATGGGAGIGGGYGGEGGKITINSDGIIEATGGYYCAGIGGGSSCSGGTISISGKGKVTATGGGGGAGIGGGYGGAGGTVTIENGTVTATGGYDGAGIGGGAGGAGGTIKITGGDITAKSKSEGAGIGGGYGGAGGTVTIENGTVTATGGYEGAGIGGGYKGDSGTISISGNGTVNAYGGTDAAGIGGGAEGACKTVEITGGKITAQGGGRGAGIGGGVLGTGGKITISGTADVTATVAETDTHYAGAAAGIGGGSKAGGGTVIINGSAVVRATGGSSGVSTGGAGIGGGDARNGGNITIESGTVTAVGGSRAAGIGGGNDAEGTSADGAITINGGNVTATGGDGGAGIGGGYGHLCRSIIINNGTVNAVGGADAPGIGSGSCCSDNTVIEINGGAVTATGGDYAAGIGGGNDGGGCTISISGGTVTATGGDGGAGIGGGCEGKGGTISISGGTVTATGGDSGAGIGGGNLGTGGKITITGIAYVTASGGIENLSKGYYGGAGIGGGGGNVSVSGSQTDGGEITISGSCTVYAFGSGCIVNRDADGNIISVERDEQIGRNGAGIGGGYNGAGGIITIEGGTVYAYGGKSGAGIGGGMRGNGGTISVSGKGKVSAYGGRSAAGIGGGSVAHGGVITITSDGTVYAVGGDRGAGIGGGDGCLGGTVEISGGTVKAEAGSENAASIGSGYDGRFDSITLSGGVIIPDGYIGCCNSEYPSELNISGSIVFPAEYKNVTLKLTNSAAGYKQYTVDGTPLPAGEITDISLINKKLLDYQYTRPLTDAINYDSENKKLDLAFEFKAPANAVLKYAALIATAKEERSTTLSYENCSYLKGKSNPADYYGLYSLTWTRSNFAPDQILYVRPYYKYTLNGKTYKEYGDIVKVTGNDIVTDSYRTVAVTGKGIISYINTYALPDGAEYNKEEKVKKGSEVTVSVEATMYTENNIFHSFSHWEDENGVMLSKDVSYTFMLTDNITLTPVYDERYVITYRDPYGVSYDDNHKAPGEIIKLKYPIFESQLTGFVGWNVKIGDTIKYIPVTPGATVIAQEYSDITVTVTAPPVIEWVYEKTDTVKVYIHGGSLISPDIKPDKISSYYCYTVPRGTAIAVESHPSPYPFYRWAIENRDTYSSAAIYRTTVSSELKLKAEYITPAVSITEPAANIIHVGDDSETMTDLDIDAQFCVPQGVTLKYAALIATTKDSVGSKLSYENCSYLKGKSNPGTNLYTLSWTRKNVSPSQVWYVRPYYKYVLDGKTYKAYGDVVAVSLIDGIPVIVDTDTAS